MRCVLLLLLCVSASYASVAYNFRVIHNIRPFQTPPIFLDIDFNGEVVATNVPFGAVVPNQGASRYLTRFVDWANLTVYETGNITNTFSATAYSLKSDIFETTVYMRTNGDANPVVSIPFTDNPGNQSPGDFQLRLINCDGTGQFLNMTINETTVIASSVQPTTAANYGYNPFNATFSYQFVIGLGMPTKRWARSAARFAGTGNPIVSYPATGPRFFAENSTTSIYFIDGGATLQAVVLDDTASNTSDPAYTTPPPPPTTTPPLTTTPNPATTAPQSPASSGTTAPPATTTSASPTTTSSLTPTPSPAPTTANPVSSAQFTFKTTDCIAPGSSDLTALYNSFAAAAGISTSDIALYAPHECPKLSRQLSEHDYLAKINDPDAGNGLDAVGLAQLIVNDINNSSLAGAPPALKTGPGSASPATPSVATLPSIALSLLMACAMLLMLA